LTFEYQGHFISILPEKLQFASSLASTHPVPVDGSNFTEKFYQATYCFFVFTSPPIHQY